MPARCRIVKFLRSPSAYPERPTTVDVVATHISWVFLTDHLAYKLKKPVQFEFVDLSTSALRREACLDELRLNRRLAPDVYLSVLPITELDDGTLQLGGSGKAIDWVVKMRRLPSDKALDRVLHENRLAPDEAQRIAHFLARFYASLPAQRMSPVDYRQALDRHIRANRAALIEALPDDALRIGRVHGAQLRYLNVHYAVIDGRVAAGRIVDGHGDLRPEHIYLEHPPAVIDCIEFSDELRRVDIADELSFLAMECQRLGHRDVGELVLRAYQEASGDEMPPALSSFYRSYRACVRGKVAVLQGQQSEPPGRDGLAGQYLEWSEHYAAELGPPLLVTVGGLMGTGKSTLAQTLAEALGAEVLSTDRIRRAMFGASTSPAKYGEGIYSPEARRRVYDRLLRGAGDVLEQGLSVILDGTFSTRQLRDRAMDWSRRYGATGLHVVCTCPRETALARIADRAQAGGTDSEARVELYDAQARAFECPTAGAAVLEVATTVDLSRQLQAVCDALRAIA